MRPNTPHNPAVEPVEELSDMGSLVVMSPSPQHWIQFLNQLPRLGTTADLARWQPKLLAALDLVPEKLESLPDMHDPCFLRVQLHAQFVQNPKRRGHPPAPPLPTRRLLPGE
jgi:hypothetical protein